MFSEEKVRSVRSRLLLLLTILLALQLLSVFAVLQGERFAQVLSTSLFVSVFKNFRENGDDGSLLSMSSDAHLERQAFHHLSTELRSWSLLVPRGGTGASLKDESLEKPFHIRSVLLSVAARAAVTPGDFLRCLKTRSAPVRTVIAFICFLLCDCSLLRLP